MKTIKVPGLKLIVRAITSREVRSPDKKTVRINFTRSNLFKGLRRKGIYPYGYEISDKQKAIHLGQVQNMDEREQRFLEYVIDILDHGSAKIKSSDSRYKDAVFALARDIKREFKHSIGATQRIHAKAGFGIELILS